MKGRVIKKEKEDKVGRRRWGGGEMRKMGEEEKEEREEGWEKRKKEIGGEGSRGGRCRLAREGIQFAISYGPRSAIVDLN